MTQVEACAILCVINARALQVPLEDSKAEDHAPPAPEASSHEAEEVRASKEAVEEPWHEASEEPWHEAPDEFWHEAAQKPCEDSWDDAWAPDHHWPCVKATLDGSWDDGNPASWQEGNSAKPWNCWDYAGDEHTWEGQGYGAEWDSWTQEDECWFQGCRLPDPVYGLSDEEEAEAWPNWGPQDEAFFGECRFLWDETKPWNCWDYAGDSDADQQPKSGCNDGLAEKAP